jgi:predicted phage tail protein
MKEIRLYGHLGKKFGRSFKANVSTPQEAMKALSANIKGFKQYLTINSEPGYHIFIDKNNIGIDELGNPISDAEVIKIVPVIHGSGGLFKIIVGVALVIITHGAYGWSMILSGVAEMLFAPPKQKNSTGNQKVENTPSYVFDGPVNTTAQGNAVPLCYGRLMVGSQVISAGLSAQQLK